MTQKKPEIEMFVAGLVMDPDSNTPIVILKDENNDEGLPIWIGVSEASSIAAALKHVSLARPLTHDLLKNVIEEFGARVLKVVIHGLEENTFIAAIEILSGEIVKRIDSRPSDAIALAVRVNAPIFVDAEVLDKAKIKIITDKDDEIEGDVPVSQDQRDYSAEDRNFKTIDKDKWAKILEGMDPNDFKYKNVKRTMTKKASSEEQLPQDQESPDLAARLHEVEGIDEDIAQIIVQNWRQVAVVVVALIAGVWLFNEYRSGVAEREGAIAKEFIEAQELVTKIKEDVTPKAQDEAEPAPAKTPPTPEQEAEKQKQIVAMQEKFRSVSQSADGNFYPGAAKLYNAIELLKKDSITEALELLKSFPIARYESKQQSAVAAGDKIAENLLAESAALLYAKALLQQETPDIETARRYLIGLAYQAHLLNVEAILTLARISMDENQRQETTTIAHDVKVGRPELAESIETAISPYGFEVK